MNLHELSKTIAKKETGKVQVSVAQIKEIIKLVSMEMANDADVTLKLIRSGAKHLEKSRGE